MLNGYHRADNNGLSDDCKPFFQEIQMSKNRFDEYVHTKGWRATGYGFYSDRVQGWFINGPLGYSGPYRTEEAARQALMARLQDAIEQQEQEVNPAPGAQT